MEGKADIADSAFSSGVFQEFYYPQLFQVFPGAFIKGVQQVVIDVIGIKTLQLLGKIMIHVLLGFDQPGRKLGGHIDALAVNLLDEFPQHRLAFAIMVSPGGVKVIYSMLHGILEHLHSCGAVDLAILSNWQPHATQAKRGKLVG